MKAQDAKCKKCGGPGKLRGSDYTDEFGPFYIACLDCGEETAIQVYPREAWSAWKLMNRSPGSAGASFGHSAAPDCYHFI
ncbi:MAG TPA: hypothetical protein ACFYEK_17950 [Candidatus Wunengus sp. YC60]|uniref:hypothetical protein n=1 Tax=Candidatus Wunengus sp. YC60 TaxID=3367697 RepID=UPI0040271751